MQEEDATNPNITNGLVRSMSRNVFVMRVVAYVGHCAMKESVRVEMQTKYFLYLK